MYSNNLNGAYDYENERRNDERCAAAESQILRELKGKRKLAIPLPVVILGILVLLRVVLAGAWSKRRAYT